MTFGTQLQLLSLPVWVRVVIGLGLAGCLMLAGGLVALFATGHGQEPYLIAGASLLGVVLPLAVGALVLGTSYGGERSLSERTEEVLTRSVPFALARLPEEAGTWHPAPVRIRSPRPRLLADVAVNHQRARCHADYRIRLPDGRTEMLLRLEINVRRANINILFPLQPGEELAEKRVQIMRHLGHSLGCDGEGATGGAAVYCFNPVLIARVIDGRDYAGLVGTIALPGEFVWNPAERLFFAQDLMLMLRSMLAEWPQAFVVSDPTPAPVPEPEAVPEPAP